MTRILWYGLDLQPISIDEAERLLASPTERIVARTVITTDRGRAEVSTVFLVLDRGFGGSPPVLWETMAFGGPDDLSTRRYTTREAALVGHDEEVTASRTALELDGAVIIAEERTGQE